MKSGPVRILLVEDNPGDARFIREILGEDGARRFELTHVQCLADALAHLRSKAPDALLLDLSLPDSTGFETIARIHQEQPDLPVVVMTGNDDEAMALRAVQRGVQDYLVKGHHSPESLARVISYAMERKRAEKAERDRQSLEVVVQSMHQVLGVVGHDLRTPLAALRATSELLLSGDLTSAAEQRAFLHAIHQEVLRMTNMVNDLLEAARLGSGTAQWRWSDNVSLEEVCQASLDGIRPLVDETQIRLECTIEPADLTMHGDPDALRRLLLNLLTNAQKHTETGVITVTARAPHDDGDGRWVELEITDSGEGIPPEVAEKLGQAFALNAGVVGSSYRQGSGLGLTICKGIVAVHGGAIMIRSRPGEGTNIQVRLRADLPGPSSLPEDLDIQQQLAA